MNNVEISKTQKRQLSLKAVKTGGTDDWNRPIAVGMDNERYVDITCGMSGHVEDWHAVTEEGEPSYPVKLNFENVFKWVDLFCAPDPRAAMEAVQIGDRITLTMSPDAESGFVVEKLVTPWRDDSRYRSWVQSMTVRYSSYGIAKFVSDIHYGGFVAINEIHRESFERWSNSMEASLDRVTL